MTENWISVIFNGKNHFFAIFEAYFLLVFLFFEIFLFSISKKSESISNKNLSRGSNSRFLLNFSSEGLSGKVFSFLIFQILDSCFLAKLGAKSVSGKYPLRHGGGLAAGQRAPVFFQHYTAAPPKTIIT